MPTETWDNNFSTTLSGNGGSITSTATSFIVASSGSLSTAGGVQYRFLCGTEIMTVTGISGTTWTVSRGAESATPGTGTTHNDGDTLYQIITRDALKTFLQSLTLTLPADLSLTGSPAVGPSGTLAVTRATQSANLVLAGPASGSAAVPAYRALVPADLDATVTPDWHAYLAWSFDPTSTAASFAPSAGRIHIAKIMTPTAFTINTIDNIVIVGGSGATALANCFVGIYDSGGTRRFASADQSTPWGTSGLKSVTVTGGYVVTAGSFIYMAILVGTQSTTAMQMPGFGPGTGVPFTAGLTAATYRAAFGGGLSAQTSLPTPTLTLASNTAGNVIYWHGLR